MLWLAHNKFVDEEPSKSRFHTHSFAIDEFVYFLWLLLPYAEANSRFVMYRVHPSKLTGHKINVIYENFSVLPLTETNVCVHGGKVFMWMQTYRQMYVGELISTGFSIRHVATIDNLVLHGRASGRYSRENCTWIFELDLATMTWTATDTVASDEIREELCSTKHRLCNEENYLVGDKMHVFVRSIETHYFLDLTTKMWSKVRAKNASKLPEDGNFFVNNGHLYMFGKKKQADCGVLYQFDEENVHWEKAISSRSNRFPQNTAFQGVSSAGRRVYFWDFTVCPARKELATTVSVLEMNPTLFDHAVLTLQRTPHGRALIEEALPSVLKDQILTSDKYED